MKAIISIIIIAICLCSCTNNRHLETGVVEKVEKNNAYAKYKVCVKEQGKNTFTKCDYYWFYTNELLQVGDTIRIGKKSD